MLQMPVATLALYWPAYAILDSSLIIKDFGPSLQHHYGDSWKGKPATDFFDISPAILQLCVDDPGRRFTTQSTLGHSLHGSAFRSPNEAVVLLMKYKTSNLSDAIDLGLSSRDFCSITGEDQNFITTALKSALLADLREYAEELNTTKALLQQSMQSHSILTNYLCHDFTNLLSVITFDVSRLDGPCTKQERLQISENILAAAQLGIHVSKTIAKLNSISNTSRISVDSWVSDNLSLMISAAHNAALHPALFAQDGLIEVDDRELLFCLLNKIIHAREAHFS